MQKNTGRLPTATGHPVARKQGDWHSETMTMDWSCLSSVEHLTAMRLFIYIYVAMSIGVRVLRTRCYCVPSRLLDLLAYLYATELYMAHSGVDRTNSEGEKIDRKKDICFAEIV